VLVCVTLGSGTELVIQTFPDNDDVVDVKTVDWLGNVWDEITGEASFWSGRLVFANEDTSGTIIGSMRFWAAETDCLTTLLCSTKPVPDMSRDWAMF
jgi:hypothetical protein